jgi:membrane-associated phospholipid phosphatase
MHNMETKRELCRFILSIIILLIILYFMSVSMAYSDNRGIDAFYNREKDINLPDLGHDFIILLFGKNWNIHDASNDITLGVLMIFTFLYVLFTQHGRRLRIYTRWILTVSIIYGLRTILIIMTIFPNAKHYHLTHSCEKWNPVWSAPYEMVFNSRRTCYDSFFSGHAGNATICAMLLCTYLLTNNYNNGNNSNNKYINLYYIISIIISIMAWLMVLLMIIFILYFQLHYTIDVCIGVIFGIIFWLICDYEIQLNIGYFSWWEPNPSHFSKNYNSLDHDINNNNNNNNNDQTTYPNYSSNYNPFWGHHNNHSNNSNNSSNNSNHSHDYVINYASAPPAPQPSQPQQQSSQPGQPQRTIDL